MLLMIRRIRLERGLEQEEVARSVGVSPGALSRIERGVQLPWPGVRARLSALYDVEEEDLFRDLDSARKFLRQTAGKSE